MLKFIRKYNKILLVGFGTFLMIAFLLPSGIQSFQGDPRNRVVATLGGKSVTALDFAMASQEREAARELLARSAQPGLAGVVGVDSEHWLLLTAAAERAGLVGREQDGRDFLTSVIQQGVTEALAQQLTQTKLNEWFAAGAQGTPPDYQQIATEASQQAVVYTSNIAAYAANKARLTQDQMDMMLAKLAGITRLYGVYSGSTEVSERAAKAAAKKALDSVEIEYVVVPGSRLGPDIIEPTPEELANHFETYREVAREEGELGVGYVLGPRVRLEWLVINRADIRSAMYVSEIQASAEYAANTAAYPGAPEIGRVLAAEALRDRQTDLAVREAERILRTEVKSKVDRLPREGMYRVLPADWSRPSLEDIAGRIHATLLAEGEKRIARWVLTEQFKRPTVVVRDAEWVSLGELGAIPGIGQGRVRVGAREGSFPALVSQVRELAKDNELGVQVGIPAIDYPVRDGDGNEYFVTVLDARDTSPAESLDEVRTMAIEDFKSINGLRRLEREMPELLSLVMAGGAEAVAARYPVPATVGEAPMLPLKVQNGNVKRDQAGDTAIDTAEFRERIFAMAEAINPLTPIADVPAEARAFAVALPKSRSVVVGRITRVTPTTNEAFRRDAEQYVVEPMIREELQAAGTAVLPFDREPLRKRLGYVPKAGERDEDEEAAEEVSSADASQP